MPSFLKKIAGSFTSKKAYCTYLILITALVILSQVVSAWFYQGPKVDEAELVLYGVGFLKGDLDPLWDGYGHLGMYMLGLLYFLIGVLSTTLGVYSDFADYGAQFLEAGYFFILARMFMATATMLAVLVICRLFYRCHTEPMLLLLFFILIAFSPTTIQYANYVRTDTLVALFTVGVLYFGVLGEGFKDLLCISVLTAAAVACKISALPISGVLGLLILHMWFTGQISFKQGIAASVTFLASTQLLSPYMDYMGLFERVLASESGEAVNAYRTHYSGLSDKLSRIWQLHSVATGKLTLVFASIAVIIGGFTRFRRLVLIASGLIFLTWLPYFFGSSLRDYWFIPSYLLVNVLALGALAIIFDLARALTPKLGYRLLVSVFSVIVVVIPVQSHLKSYANYYRHYSASGPSNRLIAQVWLEKNSLGVDSILVDKNFSNVYPRLADPAYLRFSRKASGLFGYHKDRNHFLAQIFERYLYEYYLQDTETSLDESRFIVLKKLRLDITGNATYVELPRLCSGYSHACTVSELDELHNVVVKGEGTEGLVLEVVGDNPSIVFNVNENISVDKSFYVDLSTDADKWKLFYDLGEGLRPELSSPYYYESKLVPIIVPSVEPIVNYLGKGDDPDKLIDIKKRVLFVTSPSGYGRFYSLRDRAQESLNLAEQKGLQLLLWHDEITKSKLVKRFEGPVGSPIEIYDISEYSRARKSN
ncbi:MAG: hypothetical protein KTR16_02910 [Acidiferrobacterales bacterium]|nr:hypothetical protein [Acidiferrobacterales bacterium]